MIIALTVGVAAMVVCLFVQGVLLFLATRYYVRHLTWVKSASRAMTMLLISQVMLMLVVGNLVQGGIWALLFVFLGEFGDWATAYYFSLVNFATLGYGDIVMSERWRILGPLQAINGVLMIGVSTASITAVVHDAFQRSWSRPNAESVTDVEAGKNRE
ncbi:ion channel [Luminiphilus sp. nBUS_07]|uniref:ion channel n=1 Tax=Luminiphilus sp. nBUS_07 TaxID=3395314 RepID=UPI003EBDA49A